MEITEVSPVVAKTIRNAVRACRATGETLYIVPTYNGPRVVKTKPTFTGYHEVTATDERFVAYEPWNA